MGVCCIGGVLLYESSSDEERIGGESKEEWIRWMR